MLGSMLACSALYASRDRTGGARFYWNIGVRMQSECSRSELQWVIKQIQGWQDLAISTVDIDLMFYAGLCLRPAEMSYDYVQVILEDLGYRYFCPFDRISELGVRKQRT